MRCQGHPPTPQWSGCGSRAHLECLTFGKVAHFHLTFQKQPVCSESHAGWQNFLWGLWVFSVRVPLSVLNVFFSVLFYYYCLFICCAVCLESKATYYFSMTAFYRRSNCARLRFSCTAEFKEKHFAHQIFTFCLTGSRGSRKHGPQPEQLHEKLNANFEDLELCDSMFSQVAALY